MTKPLFRVVRVGGQIACRGLGRQRTMHNGLTEGGAMDRHAARWANHLLGRPTNSPVFEITLGNIELEIEIDCQASITGADLGATLEGVSILPWRTYHLKRGDSLKFALPRSGLRAYMALRAELNTTPEQLIDENADVCALEVFESTFDRAVPKRFIPDYHAPLTLQVLRGYQYDQFPDSAIETLLSSEYVIQANSSRMAYRLQGEAITHGISNLYSEGIAYGAIQIPPDGQPVILLNDRQTMGGYPKVGCITRGSGCALSQRMASQPIRFEFADFEEASRVYLEQLRFFKA